MKRVFLNSIVAIFFITGPWWLFFASLISFPLMLRRAYEPILWGFIWDMVYSVPFEGPLTFSLWGTVVGIGAYFISRIVESEVRFV